MKTSAGKRNCRVSFYSVAYTIDAAGHRAETRTLYGSAWAQVLPVSARELEIARGFSEQVSYTVTILHNPDIVSSMVLTTGGLTLSIQGVIDPDSTRKEMKLFCSKVPAAGGGS
jgi:SPP1 family predicted phage head-tail adaptor